MTSQRTPRGKYRSGRHQWRLGLRLASLCLAFAGLANAGVVFADEANPIFESRWTAEPVERLAPDTIAKEGTSLVKLKLLTDSIYLLDAPFASNDRKWKLPALTELDGMVSSLPVACSQTERRKAKYNILNGSYFEAANLCLVDSDNDGSFDKMFEQSGFGLRWMTFEQAVNDGRKNDNRMSLRSSIPANAITILPLHYTKIRPEDSKNLLYINIFYVENHSLVGEFSLGFCIDYKALIKPCSSLRPMTFLQSFKKAEVPLTHTMIGTQFTIQRYVAGSLDIRLDHVPDHHVIKINPNPFNIE